LAGDHLLLFDELPGIENEAESALGLAVGVAAGAISLQNALGRRGELIPRLVSLRGWSDQHNDGQDQARAEHGRFSGTKTLGGQAISSSGTRPIGLRFGHRPALDRAPRALRTRVPAPGRRSRFSDRGGWPW